MKTEILKIDEFSLTLAANIIREEGLVVFPTETVYGLGGLATSDKAVRSIYEAKGRPSDNPLIVHVHPDYDISALVETERDYARKLREKFVPGPLTMVYKSKGKVSPLVSAGLDSLAVRVPSDVGAQRFLRAVNAPIAAPSANASKHVSPVTAKHVYDDLNGRIPLILDGGRCRGGIESTVLDVTGSAPVILRSGLITYDMIKAVAGKCEYATHREGDRVRSPGVKYRHYAPRCKTAFFARENAFEAAKEYDRAAKEGLRPIIVCDDGIKELLPACRCIGLGKTSEEFASNVYYALHLAEERADYVIGIGVEGDSQVDVGVMNRLTKACGKNE